MHGARIAKQEPLALMAFTAPVVLDVKDFLANKGHSAADVERMHSAWIKSVLLSLALWTRPYTRDHLW